MLGGSIARHLDKQILFQLYSRTEINKYKRLLNKNHYPLLIVQSSFTNLLNSLLVKQIVWGQNSDIKYFLKNNATGKKSTLKTITDIFDISYNTANDIVVNNPKLLLLRRKYIIENYQTLLNAGLNASQIIDNVLLLSHKNISLEAKINVIQKFTNKIDEGIPFMYYNLDLLNKFENLNLINANENRLQSQLNYLETKYKIKRLDTYRILANYIFYLVQDSELTLNKIKLIIDNGVSVKSIVDNQWPIYYSYKKMKTRFELFFNNELLLPPKPWILKCSDIYFRQIIEQKTKLRNKKDTNLEIINFLCKQSGFDKALVKYKIKKLRLFNEFDFDEMKKTIDIIIQKGYTYHDIMWSVNVLTLKYDFVKNQFDKLELHNHKAPFLDVLLLSNRDFAKYVNRLSIKL